MRCPPLPISASVVSLVTQGVLNAGQGNSLTSKLSAAIDQANRGNGTAARNQLQAFINEVNALIGSERLSTSQGQDLIAAADHAISRIP